MQGLIVEITGLEQKDKVVQLVSQTFGTLKEFADFDKKLISEPTGIENPLTEETSKGIPSGDKDPGLNLAYIINLVLPKTDDPAVFNAIFKALRENLLRR